MASLSGVFRVGDCIFLVHFLKDFSFGRILFGVHVSNYWWFAFCLGRLFRLINLSTKWGFETARIHSIHRDTTVNTHSLSYVFYHVKKYRASLPVWALECWHDVLGLEKQMLSSVTAGRMIPRWSGSSSKSCLHFEHAQNVSWVSWMYPKGASHIHEFSTCLASFHEFRLFCRI